MNTQQYRDQIIHSIFTWYRQGNLSQHHRDLANLGIFENELLNKLLDKAQQDYTSDRKKNINLYLKRIDKPLHIHRTLTEWDDILSHNWYWQAFTRQQKEHLLQERIVPVTNMMDQITRKITDYIYIHFGIHLKAEIATSYFNGSSFYRQANNDKPGDLDGVMILTIPQFRDLLMDSEQKVELFPGLIMKGFALESTSNVASNHPHSVEAFTSSFGSGIPLYGTFVLEGTLSRRNYLLHAFSLLQNGFDHLGKEVTYYRKWINRSLEAKLILQHLNLLSAVSLTEASNRLLTLNHWVTTQDSIELTKYKVQALEEYDQLVRLIQKQLAELRDQQLYSIISQALDASDQEQQQELLKEQLVQIEQSREEQHCFKGSGHFYSLWLQLLRASCDPHSDLDTQQQILDICDATLLINLAHHSSIPTILFSVFQSASKLPEHLHQSVIHALGHNPHTPTRLLKILSRSSYKNL